MQLIAYQNHRRLLAFAGWMLLLWLTAPAAGADTQSGVDWLLAQQQTDGGYGTHVDLATPVQSTAEALRALYGWGQEERPGILDAERYLAQTPFHNTEYLARKIISAVAAGQSVPEWIDELLSHQSPDGGFGDRPGYQSTVLDSACALEALATATIHDSGNVGRALGFLLERQGADGSWAQSGNAPSLYLTALAMRAVWTHRHTFSVDPVLEAAQNYLLNALGNGAANEIFATASVLLAIIPRLHDIAAVAGPLAVLQASQGADGSWGGVYTTALALRVLALAQQVVPNPDLGTLAGRVIDGDSGLPLDGVTATLEGPLNDTLTTAADGVFRFRALPAGDYTLTLALADYPTLTTTTRLSAGDTLNLGELTLIRGATPSTGTLHGTVTDADTGLSLADVLLSTDQGLSAITGVDGSYRIGNLAPGQITVTASFDGYRSTSGRATLSAGGIIVFSPALRPDDGPDQDDEAAFFGQITEAATGLPLAGVDITIAGATHATVQSDAEGLFRIAPVNPGPHDIAAHLAGYDAVTAGVLVFAGQQIDFSPALYPLAATPPGANTAHVTGVMVDAATGEPLPGVRVAATYGGNTEVSITGIDGRFTVSGVTSAELKLDFALDDYRTVTFSLPIEPLATRDIGPVRMWPESLEALLPDLVIHSVDTANRTSDPYTLAVGGTLEVVIANQGSAPTGNGFEMLAFHDTDLDGLYSPGTDLPLGRAGFTDILAIGMAGSVSIPVDGHLPFRDAPIGLWVDSTQVLPELDEDNNTRSTAEDCSVVGFEPGEHFDLSSWAPENVPGAGGGGPARWTLNATNTRVTQEVNNYSSLYLNDFDFSNGRIGGTMQVDTGSDDDHIGLVWGYRDERHYYLLYWAHRHSLPDYHLTVRKVDSTRLYPLSDATILYHGVPRWEHHVEYEYVLDFRPGGFELLIKQDGAVLEDIVIADDSYISGKFGFFDHSQAMARFTARPHWESSTPVPDLSVALPELIDNGTGQPLSLSVRIGNGGGPMASGRSAQVGFYHGDPDAGGILLGTLPFAAPGSGQYTQLRLDGLVGLTGGELFAVVDPLGTTDECSEANNRVSLPLSSAPTLGNLQVGTDTAAYGPSAAVALWARVLNSGSFASDYRVDLRIEDSTGAVVTELTPRTLAALTAGAAETLSGNWNSGTTLAGGYVLRGLLYDGEQRLLDEATAAFVIQPRSGPRVSLRTTTDRARYHITDTVELRNLVRNLTANLLIGDARLHLSVTDPAGLQIHAQSIALGQLPAAATRDLNTPYALNAANPGTYQASGVVLDGNGTVLAGDSAAFEVFQDSAKTLSGEVTAQFDQRYLGQQQICTDRISNSGPLAIENLTIRRLLTRLDEPSEIEQLSDLITLPAGDARTLVRSIETGPLAAGDYACVLQALFDPDWTTLDFDEFRLDIPPIDATLTTGTRGRLLVLLDAPPQDSGPGGGDPHGNDPEPTLNAQRAYLEELLTRDGWSYTLVTHKDAFAEELHSGGYSAYAVLAEQEKLDESVQKELREAVFRGEGLLVAGGHDQRHHGLQPALGVLFRGRHPDAGGLALEGGTFAPPGQSPFGFTDHALRADPAGAQTVGRFDGTGENPAPAAVTGHAYGWGRSVYGGFDLLAQAVQAGGDNLFSALLLDALEYVQPHDTRLADGAVIPVSLTLTNSRGTQSVAARLWPPASAQIIAIGSLPGDVEVQPDGSLLWSVELAENQSATLVLWVRLPRGSHTFSADIGQGSSEWATLEIPASMPLAAVIDQAAALEAADKKGPYKQVRQSLERAESWLQKERPDQAIVELLKATEPLQDEPSLEAAELRRASGWQIWNSARLLVGP